MYWTGNSIAVILYCFSGVGIKMLWEPRRERFQEEVTVYGKSVGGTKIDLWKEKQQQLQQEIEEGLRQLDLFIAVQSEF